MNYNKQRNLLLNSAFFAVAFFILGTLSVFANHPVLVEGNCNVPPAGSNSAMVAGTCGDFDGDGRIGTAEDGDGDRVFGTINGANGSNGISNNGTITIVTSGTFPETVMITGNVTLQAAPGVTANLDAVLQGDSGSGARQGQAGIIVNSPNNRYVVIRNILSKNWTSGIQVNGSSRVAIENCKFENNINYGIEVNDNAKVSVSNSSVYATGFRLNPGTGDFPAANAPQPGIGISFEDNSSGAVFLTTVTGSFAAGISDTTGNGNGRGNGRGNGNVCVSSINVFDNSPNLQNINQFSKGCTNKSNRGNNGNNFR